jgi:hypothetical protein
MKSTSRHASFCRTSLRWHHTSGHVTVTSLHPRLRRWFCHTSYVWPHDLTRHIRRKYDPEQDMKSETYSSRPFIWYTTWLPFKNFNIFFALDDLAPHPRKGPSHTCWKGPEIWNPKPTRQDLSFDILPDYLSKTFFLHLMTLPPPSRNDPKYEIRNLHVKIFHLIYYITTFLKLLKQIALDEI